MKVIDKLYAATDWVIIYFLLSLQLTPAVDCFVLL